MAGDSLILRRHDDGLVEELVADESGNAFALKRSQDIEPLIDANRRQFNADPGTAFGREMVKVASFPPDAPALFTAMFGADPFKPGNEKLLERILNDPDLAKFRTAPGRVKVTEK